jgi:hypothetical protein
MRSREKKILTIRLFCITVLRHDGERKLIVLLADREDYSISSGYTCSVSSMSFHF